MKEIINSKVVKDFLTDYRVNSEIFFLEEAKEQDDLVAIAKAKGIDLTNNTDLAGFKCVYAFANEANKNRARLPEEPFLKALPTMIGKPVDIDHIRNYVVGHYLDYRYIAKEKKTVAYGVFYKSNFEDEWETVKAKFKNKTLATSYEIWCPKEKRKNLPDGTFELLEQEIAGGAILFNEEPAFEDAKVLEIAKKKSAKTSDKMVYASKYTQEDIILSKEIKTISQGDKKMETVNKDNEQKPEQAKTEEVKPVEVKVEPVKEEVKPESTKVEETKPNEEKPVEATKAEEVKPVEVAKAEEPKATEPVKTEEVKPVEVQKVEEVKSVVAETVTENLNNTTLATPVAETATVTVPATEKVAEPVVEAKKEEQTCAKCGEKDKVIAECQDKIKKLETEMSEIKASIEKASKENATKVEELTKASVEKDQLIETYKKHGSKIAERKNLLGEFASKMSENDLLDEVKYETAKLEKAKSDKALTDLNTATDKTLADGDKQKSDEYYMALQKEIDDKAFAFDRKKNKK